VRLAWVSPLPPLASGIADYSYELLPLVAEQASVDAYSQPAGRWHRLRKPAGVRVLDPSRLNERAGEYDSVIYHLGNNPFHEPVYRAALERPGVTVFHDFTLHHLLAYLFVEHGHDPVRYEELLRNEYGEEGERLARLRVRKSATEFEKFVFPLNAHIARRAQALIVHSRDVAERMSVVAPGVPVTVIPHHAGSPPPDVAGISQARARRILGLPAQAFLVGQFGYITRPKQPSAVIEGFARLVAERDDARLLLVGADHLGGALQILIRRHGIGERVLLPGFVDLTKFYLYLKAVDVVVNLRYPSAGEASGTFARALAEGKPVIVNNVGSFAEAPAGVSLKVEIDGDQSAELGAHLARLAADESLRQRMSAAAREYASTVLNQRRCADMYVEVARTAATAEGVTPAA
jgi:glycosyltransferase involved in cell wall biosynthesis